MASESIPPQGKSRGGLKYAILGLLLLLATAALVAWVAFTDDGGGEPTVAERMAQVDAGTVERSTEMVVDDLVIPDLVPDSGPGVDAGPTTPRVVTRYVNRGDSWGRCTGTLNQSAAGAVLREHALQFRNCYERRLKVNNTLEGRVSLRIQVGRTGQVSAVQAGGSLRDPQVLSCVRNIAQRLRFPQPQGGPCAVVAAPFTFTPRN